MKRILLLLTVSAVLFSCNKAGVNEYIISGTVKGIADGKTVVLEKQDETGQLKPIDTVKIKDGKFTIKGSSKIDGFSKYQYGKNESCSRS